MKDPLRILFVSSFHAPFIQDDLDALEKHYIIRKQIGRGVWAIFKILWGLLSADVVICWFASVYAFVGVAAGRFLGIKSLVVVGGVDAAKDQDLNYGIWLSPWRARLVKYVFLHANRMLVVDPCLREEAVNLAGYDGTNISYLPTGYESEFWKPVGEKEPIVLTVAVVHDETTARRKGIDVLIEAARRLPAITFFVVGTELNVIEHWRPPMNMKIVAPIPREDVLRFYQRAKVYCQPSRREGLPNALCEAMLCGCIPVASDVSGNPTAVGTEGLLIPVGDSAALADALKLALTLNEEVGMKARARIVSLFPKEKREQGLLRFIEDLRQ